MDSTSFSMEHKASKASKGLAHSIPKFIRRFFDLLENGEYSNLVSWNDDGTAFMIRDATQFANTVLPKYFKHNKISSFIRQLNMYDFAKQRNQGFELVYSHPYFQRQKRDLLSKVIRKTNSSHPSQHEHSLEKLSEDSSSSRLRQIKAQNEALIANVLLLRQTTAEINKRIYEAQVKHKQLVSSYQEREAYISMIKESLLVKIRGIHSISRHQIPNNMAYQFEKPESEYRSFEKMEYPCKRLHKDENHIVPRSNEACDNFIDYSQFSLPVEDLLKAKYDDSFISYEEEKQERDPYLSSPFFGDIQTDYTKDSLFLERCVSQDFIFH